MKPLRPLQRTLTTLVLSSALGCSGIPSCGGDETQPAPSPVPTAVQRDLVVDPFGVAYGATRHKVPYRAPTPSERITWHALGSDLLAAVQTEDTQQLTRLAKVANGLGLVLEFELENPQGWVRLYEAREQRRGWGTYLFRAGPLDQELILQAPHTWHDAKTGDIGLALFKSMPARAYFFNSTHRNQGTEEGQVSDVAHSQQHPFTVMTTALLTLRNPLVVQLHGFASKPEREGVEMVISAGRKDGISPWASHLADQLSPHFLVRRYPQQVDWLGGTTNAQGKVLRRAGLDRFIHLEMNPDARQRLHDDPRTLRLLAQSLLKLEER